jgi:hypothetical protein
MTAARKRILAAAIVAIIAIAVGAGVAVFTGGGSANTGSSSTASRSVAFQKFRQCLQQNGVTPRQPGTSGSRPQSNPAFAKAMQACRQYAPPRAPGSGFGPPGSGQNAPPAQ